MLLSIIVPIYNVECYLKGCLDSLLSQDLALTDYEIIVVDDGGQDKSLEIAQDYASKFDNIRIVSRENGGLAAARNSGIEASSGKYLWFVDSDDHIAPNCIRKLVRHAEMDSLDILCFNLILEFDNGSYKDCPIQYEQEGKVYNGSEFFVNVKMHPSSCIALYRREFLVKNNLKFYEGLLHEDQEFTPRAYCLADRVAFYNWPIYYYYQRSGSIMKSTDNKNCKRCKDLLTISNSLYTFANKNCKIGTDVYNCLMNKVYFCYTQSMAFYAKGCVDISAYKNQPYYPMDASICKGNMKSKIKLANFSPYLYLLLHRWSNIIKSFKRQ